MVHSSLTLCEDVHVFFLLQTPWIPVLPSAKSHDLLLVVRNTHRRMLACLSFYPELRFACVTDAARERYNRDGLWSCPVCYFSQTKPFLKRCTMCASDNPYIGDDLEVKWQCGACSYQNAQFSEQCRMCGLMLKAPDAWVGNPMQNTSHMFATTMSPQRPTALSSQFGGSPQAIMSPAADVTTHLTMSLPADVLSKSLSQAQLHRPFSALTQPGAPLPTSAGAFDPSNAMHHLMSQSLPRGGYGGSGAPLSSSMQFPSSRLTTPDPYATLRQALPAPSYASPYTQQQQPGLQWGARRY